MTKKILLTGDRPTGKLHIGHYFGSLITRKKLSLEYETYIMSADIQALTDNYDNPQKVKDNVYETLKDNIALELSENTRYFVQSQIPEIAELTVLLSNLVSINRLMRNPTIKSEISEKEKLFGKAGEKVPFGFIGYPVSQAADILTFKANVVPVGQDQLPVMEICREIAKKFNSIYGHTFDLPEAILSNTPRLKGLDGSNKMSKSLNNSIYLADTEDITIQKIMSAKTDSLNEIYFDEENRPEVSQLMTLFSLVTELDIEEIEYKYKNLGFREFKSDLANRLNKYFYKFRQRRMQITDLEVQNIINESKIHLKKRASETLREVKNKLKINY